MFTGEERRWIVATNYWHTRPDYCPLENGSHLGWWISDYVWHCLPSVSCCEKTSERECTAQSAAFVCVHVRVCACAHAWMVHFAFWLAWGWPYREATWMGCFRSDRCWRRNWWQLFIYSLHTYIPCLEGLKAAHSHSKKHLKIARNYKQKCATEMENNRIENGREFHQDTAKLGQMPRITGIFRNVDGK